MRFSARTLLLFLCSLCPLLSGALFPPAGPALIIKNVNVITMVKEEVLRNRYVVVRNGRIEKIAVSLDLKKYDNAELVDGTGKYLMPGLTDMHTHFFYEQGENINTCEAEMKLMLANGVTTARILCGDPAYLDARKMEQEHKWAGPRLYVSSPQFVGKWPWKGKVFAAICTTPAEAEAAVKKYKREGYDEIKITFMVKADVYDAIIKAAKQEGIKVTGHVGPMVKLPRALAAKQQIEHMDEFTEMLLPDTSFNHGMSVSDMGVWKKAHWETVDHLDEAKIPALVSMVKAAGIVVTPTNYFFMSCFGSVSEAADLKNKPDYRFIPRVIEKERWEVREHYLKMLPSAERRNRYIAIRKKMTRELWKAGVKLMAGSDSPEWFLVQGPALHNELETFVACGLTPYAALETATKNPATYLGIFSSSGTVEEGKSADLLLLDASPLDDIKNTRKITAVIREGKMYDAATLNRLQTEAAATLRPE